MDDLTEEVAITGQHLLKCAQLKWKELIMIEK